MTDRIGTPEKILSEKDSTPVTFQELEYNITDQNVSKAEGTDGITNTMIKELPLSGRLNC